MKYIIALFSIFLCIGLKTNAQDTNSVFFERANKNAIRFYYDVDYYLVDKNCEFKYIERVANFDVTNNQYNGPFKDFDPFGRAILIGNYKNGKKEGDFTAYYADGTLKWQSYYIDDLPHGETNYFYPDGKPMLKLIQKNNNTFINSFWDKTGKQTIINGEGNIDITLPILGYTEHGFTKYCIRGEVKAGQRNGLWRTYFVNDDKKKSLVPFLIESYDTGFLRVKEIDPTFENILIDMDELNYAPSESFMNAELLQSKNCSFDEHTGFNSFIAQKFSTYLNQLKTKLYSELPLSITYDVRVTKNGEPYSTVITETSRKLNQTEVSILSRMINQINYYLPSYSEGKPIADKLSISLQIHNNGTQIIISPVQITREKGF